MKKCICYVDDYEFALIKAKKESRDIFKVVYVYEGYAGLLFMTTEYINNYLAKIYPGGRIISRKNLASKGE